MRLTAYLNGTRVGWFDQRSAREITLEYDPAWQHKAGRLELSLSLPKSRREHAGTAPGNYLWNLLPDNNEVLERWGRTFGVSPRNPLALLAHVGRDAAGAVQLLPCAEHDEPELRSEGGFEPLTEAMIADHLRELRRDPSAWVTTDYEGGYFSLAGAQSKFTLLRTADGWSAPTGSTPSTHIVKPGVIGLTHSDLNEHLTMRAASFSGLRVAKSEVMRFEDQTAIVVARFDRAQGEDRRSVVRRHQEDFAQATGTHPIDKYQSEGGPSIRTIGHLIRENLGRTAGQSVEQFFVATLFNWAALGTDAHAKNYAVLYGKDRLARSVLAPLYDLASALVYPAINNRRTARLAMSYAGHYRVYEIEPRHIVREAAGVGISDEAWVIDRARELAHGLPEAFNAAVAEAGLTGDDAVFAGGLVDKAYERSEILRRQLAGAL